MFLSLKRQAGTRIVLSYFVALSLVIGIGILAIVQLNRISVNVNDLTNNLAVDSELANDIISQALLARFYAHQFVRTQSQADVDRFNQEFAKLEDLLALAERQITDPERVRMLSHIKQAVEVYRETFGEAVDLVRERQGIHAEVLDIQGHAIESELVALRIHINSLRDPLAFLAFGNAQNASQRMRLYTSEYLDGGDDRYAVQFELSYQEALEAFSSLERALEDPAQSKNAADAKAAADAYYQGFQSVHADYAKLKEILETMLNVQEPEISSTASEMAASIEEQFKTQNETSQALIFQARLVLVLTTTIAILTGLVLSIVVIRQIAERERAQEALRESEERYRTLFEGMPVGLYRTTSAGQMTDANPALVEMLGYSNRQALLAVNVADHYVEAEDRRQWQALMETEGSGHSFEVQFRRQDGTIIWARDSARAVRDNGEKAVYYEGSLEDITERKRAEEALRKHHDHLEELVEERTAELRVSNERLQQQFAERLRAEQQLQRYATELERSNEEIRQFTYIVSHDLRAPLTSLKGFASELHDAMEVIGSTMDTALPHLDGDQQQAVTTALQDEVPEALGFIESSATRMDRFLNALLKLARLGRRELRLEPIDMNALVRVIINTLAHQIVKGGVKVTVDPLPEVVADRTSMEQTIGNILDNALKYLDPDRPGKIKISAERGMDETSFHVRDNGQGIAEEDMDKVFAPFRRLGRQDVPGEGMGLPYVQALVRRHGGQIWCDSQLGVGTTFTFTLPNHLAEEGAYV